MASNYGLLCCLLAAFYVSDVQTRSDGGGETQSVNVTVLATIAQTHPNGTRHMHTVIYYDKSYRPPHHRSKRAETEHYNRMDYFQKKAFLNAHNDIRRKVQPPATDMHELVWDPYLATEAQHLVDNCLWKEGIRDYLPFKAIEIQVNTYAVTEETVNPAEVVSAWISEGKHYSYETDTCANGTECYHYKQIIWAQSKLLGCAINFCFGVGIWRDAYFVACEYNPGGNQGPGKPYTEGKRCSSCPVLTSCDDGLCAPWHSCLVKTCADNYVVDQADCSCRCIRPNKLNYTSGKCIHPPKIVKDEFYYFEDYSDEEDEEGTTDTKSKGGSAKSGGWMRKPCDVISVVCVVMAVAFTKSRWLLVTTE